MLSGRLELVQDIIFPYGDRRQVHFDTVWEFDLDEDSLLFTKRESAGRLPLSLLRQRLVTFSDFEPCFPPRAPNFDLERDFPPSYWTPKLRVPERNKAFVYRVFEDFNHQWRHILRHRYNDVTFRQLIRAVLQIATLKFTIKEITKANLPCRPPFVWSLTLPKWRSLDQQIARVGRMWVVATQNPYESVKLIQKRLSTHENELEMRDDGTDFLILSIRHVILCRLHQGKLEWTKPEPFLDGINPCSTRAVELLLWAVSPSVSPQSSLQRLPLEIQDNILLHVSEGPVEAARFGCSIGLGSPFSWLARNEAIRREEFPRHRFPFTRVESQIWFDGHMSGVSYSSRHRLSPDVIR